MSAPSIEDFIAAWLNMRSTVFPLTKLGQGPVHPSPCPALISQRTMLGNAMPRIKREIIRECELRRRVKLLSGNSQGSDWNERRERFRPSNGRVFDRHAKGICLELDEYVEFNVALSKRGDHRFAEIVIRRMSEGQP